MTYCCFCLTMSPVKLFLASDCHVSYCALCLRTCFIVPFVSDCVTFLNVLWVCVTRLVVCLVIMSHAFLCSAPNSDLCLTVSHVLLNLVWLRHVFFYALWICQVSYCVSGWLYHVSYCALWLTTCLTCLTVLCGCVTCLFVLCVQVMCLTVQYEGWKSLLL